MHAQVRAKVFPFVPFWPVNQARRKRKREAGGHGWEREKKGKRNLSEAKHTGVPSSLLFIKEH